MEISKKNEGYQLCICNNCSKLMYDENPGDQPFFNVSTSDDVQYMKWMSSDDDLIALPKLKHGESWPVCPKCMTDEYLMDYEG